MKRKTARHELIAIGKQLNGFSLHFVIFAIHFPPTSLNFPLHSSVQPSINPSTHLTIYLLPDLLIYVSTSTQHYYENVKSFIFSKRFQLIILLYF